MNFSKMSMALFACALVSGLAVFTFAPSSLVAAEQYDSDLKVFFGYSTRYETVDEGDCRGQIRVRRVISGEAAERAGIRSGDLIRAINNVPIQFANELEYLRSLGSVEPGDTVQLTVLRHDEELTVEIQPGALTEQQKELNSQYLSMLEECIEQGRCTGCMAPGQAFVDSVRKTGLWELEQAVAASPSQAAVIEVRKPLEGSGLVYLSEEVEIPKGMDLTDLGPFADLPKTLKPGQSKRFRLHITKGGGSELEVLDLLPAVKQP